MKDKLLKIAKYLSQNGLHTEAAAIRRVAHLEENWEHLKKKTLRDVVTSEATKSPEQKLIDRLHAAEIVRNNYKGKSPDEIMALLGLSKQDPDYDSMIQELREYQDPDSFYSGRP